MVVVVQVKDYTNTELKDKIRGFLDKNEVDLERQFLVLMSTADEVKEDAFDADYEDDEEDDFDTTGAEGLVEEDSDEEDSDNTSSMKEEDEEDIEYEPEELELRPGDPGYEDEDEDSEEEPEEDNSEEEEPKPKPAPTKNKRKGGFRNQRMKKEDEEDIITERDQIDEQQGTRGALTPKKAMGPPKRQTPKRGPGGKFLKKR